MDLAVREALPSIWSFPLAHSPPTLSPSKSYPPKATPFPSTSTSLSSVKYPSASRSGGITTQQGKISSKVFAGQFNFLNRDNRGQIQTDVPRRLTLCKLSHTMPHVTILSLRRF